MTRYFFTFLFLIISYINLNAQFNESVVKLDFTSIDKIMNSPDEILENVDLFWDNDSAYILAKEWHKSTEVPVQMKKWAKSIKKLSKLSVDKRENHETKKLVDELKSKEEIFINKVIQHIASFLPEQTPKVSTKIYFTAYTVPWAFAVDGNSVISLSDKHYHNNAEYVLNLMIHELFHVGYGHNIKLRKEEKLKDNMKHYLIAQLHNEGLATYVAYTGQSIFSANGYEPDFMMFENPETVQEKINDVNEIFKKAISNDKKLNSYSWDIGVMKRAYYVTGAYMCKVIEEKLGRDKLAETIEYGPRTFINTYNSLVKENQKIIVF